MPQMNPSGMTIPPPNFQGSGLPREESYIENILRLNRGKPGTFYFSFDNAIAIAGAPVFTFSSIICS